MFVRNFFVGAMFENLSNIHLTKMLDKYRMLNGLTMSHQQILYNNFGTCSPSLRSYLNIEQELGQIASFNKIAEHINFTLD